MRTFSAAVVVLIVVGMGPVLAQQPSDRVPVYVGERADANGFVSGDKELLKAISQARKEILGKVKRVRLAPSREAAEVVVLLTGLTAKTDNQGALAMPVAGLGGVIAVPLTGRVVTVDVAVILGTGLAYAGQGVGTNAGGAGKAAGRGVRDWLNANVDAVILRRTYRQ